MHLCERCDPGSIPGGPMFRFFHYMHFRNIKSRLKFRFLFYVTWIISVCLFFIIIVFVFISNMDKDVYLENEFKTDIENLKAWSELLIKWRLFTWKVLWEETFALISSDWIKFVLVSWSYLQDFPLNETIEFTWKIEYLKWPIPYITVIK